MSIIDGLRHVLRTTFNHRAVDAETEEELAFHLERQTQKYVAAGKRPAEAARLAKIDLGGLQRWREATDSARPSRYVRDFLADARFALRGLVTRPTFSLAALSTLAIGIGACITIFSVVDGALLKPLPVPAPDRVMSLVLRMPIPERSSVIDMTWSYPKYAMFRREQREFAALALHSSETMVVGNSAGAERLPGEMAGVDYFRILGARAARGRLYTAAEDSIGGASQVVVLSDRLWRTRFGARNDLLGRPLMINGVPRRVIGIMEPGFSGLSGDALYWVPVPGARSVGALQGVNTHNMELLGRLNEGVSVNTARAAAATIGARIDATYSRENGKWSAAAYTLDEIRISPAMRRSFTLLGIAVVLLLAIVCVNLTTLLTTRSASRSLEFTVRTAIGAERFRLVRQLVAESGVLAVLGMAVGSVLAVFATRLLATTLPLSMPTTSVGTDLTRLSFAAVGFSWRVAAMSAGLTLIVGLVIGLASATQVSGDRLAIELRSGKSSRQRGRGFLAGSRLAAGQVALALAFLVASGMTIDSLRRTLAVPLGFDPSGLLTMRITLDPVRSATESPLAMWDAIAREIRATPGVVSIAAGSCLAVGMHCDGTTIAPAGHRAESRVMYLEVMPGYFDAMKTPVIRGRVFEPRDMSDTSARDIAIINETAARTIWGTADPLTTPIVDGDRRIQVIGIVADARYGDLERPAEAAVFMRFRRTRGVLLVRTSVDPAGLSASVTAAIHRAGAGHATGNARPMSDRVRDATARARLVAQLFTSFALSALILAALGVYGTLALQVAQRAREFAIRRALGAPASAIAAAIGGQAVATAITGLVLGGATSAAVASTLGRLLYDVRSLELRVVGLSILALVGVVTVAALIPMRRSLRIDPRDAMTAE